MTDRRQSICGPGYWLFLFLAIAFVVSCGGKNKNVKAVPDADPVTAPPAAGSGAPEAPAQEVGELAARAEEEIQDGQELASEKRWDEARLAFDRAVDLLLSAPGGVELHPELKPVYDRALAQIHALELASSAEQPEDPDTETAGLEDLASTVDLPDVDPDADVVEEPAAAFDLPIERNAQVNAIIRMFQTRRRDWFQEALRRSGRYIDFFRQVFREEGLPQDLVYLAMVESAFKPRAVSRANAHGIWQFIAGTGRRYALTQDYWVDERYDPEKSTRAAARHLKDLYDELGDWYLAMASYNAGINKIRRAIRRTGTRDFWKIARTRTIARETKSYVPLILAAVVIAKDPVGHGFDPELDPPLRFDVVSLDAPVDLATAARCAGASLEDMKQLNPELRQWVTPSNRTRYELRVPAGSGPAFATAIAAIPPEERVRFVTHTVRRGDTLSHIAGRYGTGIAALAQANRITTRSIIRPGQVLTVPIPAGAGVPRAVSGRSGEAIVVSDSDVYVVRRGDTLSEIAQAHRVPVRELRRLNGLGGRSVIHPGQKLVLRSDGLQAGHASPAPAGARTHRVARGDTLGKIARRHRVSVSDLCRWNGLTPRSRIYPGQEIVLHPADVVADSAASGRLVYQIRRGDTLSAIAERFAVSVEELRTWNNLRHDRIRAGESLEILRGGQ